MANDLAVKMKDMVSWLEKDEVKAAIQKACAKHLTGERLVRIVASAVSRNPALLECTRESMYAAVLACGQLGVEPNLLGEAYLVPYNNSKLNRKEVQFQIGYRGLVSLARRSGEISTIMAEVVHEKDTFDYRLGDDPRIEHTPALVDDPGKVTHVYAIAILKDGGKQREVMTKGQIEKIRARSKAKDSGPWVTDWEAMAKKTVIKRLCKLLPMSIEMEDAIGIDTEMDIDAKHVPLTEVQATVVQEDTAAPRSRNSAKARKAVQERVEAEAETPKPSESESSSDGTSSGYISFFVELEQNNPAIFAKMIAKASETNQDFLGIRTAEDLNRFDESDHAFLMTQYQAVM